MLCQNCKKNEANVKYTQIVNGVKKEMSLCEECASKFGIEKEMNFNIPIDLSSFFGEIFGEYNENMFFPTFQKLEEEKCSVCGLTYKEFVDTGKFGCGACYEKFADRIDPILRNLHGSNRHIGRKGKVIENKTIQKIKDNKENVAEKEKNNKIEELKEKLKQAIKEERYEDAAKIRDEIKKKEK